MRGISEDRLIDASNEIWCLPHHPAFHPQKSGKVRVVFDAAATFKGKGFNSELHTGPDFVLLVS